MPGFGQPKRALIGGLLLAGCLACGLSSIFLLGSGLAELGIRSSAQVPDVGPKTCVPARPTGVGDASSCFDPVLYDARFPEMREWASAGVRGRIPPRPAGAVRSRLKPGDNIQAALDQAVAVGGGVVLLAPGVYRLERRLDMRSGVILRGEDKETTILENHLRTARRKEREIIGIGFGQLQKAGLEDLTIVHPVVAAMPPESYAGYWENQNGITDLHVGHLAMWLCKDCWVDNCSILFSGTDPVLVDGCKHVTFRGNLVKGCFNKGNWGSGFYMVMRSEHVLCVNETVLGLRHFGLQWGTRYSVFLNCYLETDINFHSGDFGHNLVQGCIVSLPEGHHWPPIAHGAARYTPPGPENVIYKFQGCRTVKGSAFACIYGDTPMESDAVYSLKTSWAESPVVYKLEIYPPRMRIFYPVTGTCLPAAQLQRRYATFQTKPVSGSPPPAEAVAKEDESF